MKKKITICSSGSFYKEVVEIKNQLQEFGCKVYIPATASIMEKEGDYDISKHKTWYKNESQYHVKTSKMKAHFKLIDKGDIVLVVNLKKKGIAGYIGGNVLLEIFYAWLRKKKIYILNEVSDKCPNKEEVLGMTPRFLGGKLGNIKI